VEELAAIHPALATADRSVLNVEGSLAAKATPGSTNPTRVGDQLAVLEVAASAARTWASGFRPVLDLGLS
jgi:argininosuccinate lyase